MDTNLGLKPKPTYFAYMREVYLDNAATTPMYPEAVEDMQDILKDVFGNPSSTHSFGRKAKSHLENARKEIGEILNCSSSEICFTSGGTEADNTAIKCAVNHLGVKNIITSKLEHKAVLDTAKLMEEMGLAKVFWIENDKEGKLDYEQLSYLAQTHDNCLISLMHANNEIGTLNDLEIISRIGRESKSFVHSDTVQTVGHFPINLETLSLDFIAAAAHKFHGPKGVGFLYCNKNNKIKGLITGGGQESRRRAGTENVAGIVGMVTALRNSVKNMEANAKQIRKMKDYLKDKLCSEVPDVQFFGDTSNNSLYTVLNIALPNRFDAAILPFQLDMNGICISSGSACNSGANKGSHVINALNVLPNHKPIRVSMSEFNSLEDLDYFIAVLKSLDLN